MTIRKFQEEFWQISRNETGLYSWAKENLPSAFHVLPHPLRRMVRDLDSPNMAREIVDLMVDEGPQNHSLINILFFALARAEIRLSNFFIPQRSHEERLTGSLLAELSSAIHTVRDDFRHESEKRYGDAREIDFFYYDLSRGGALEKKTGADLALIFHVDLPDLPEFTRYAAFQVKKIDKSTQLDKQQFRTIVRQFQQSACYLFYDMNFSSLFPPMVVESKNFESKSKKDENTKSFAVNRNDALSGLPLSLWLISRLYQASLATEVKSLDDALRLFAVGGGQTGDLNASRLGIISVGNRLHTSVDPEVGLTIS